MIGSGRYECECGKVLACMLCVYARRMALSNCGGRLCRDHLTSITQQQQQPPHNRALLFSSFLIRNDHEWGTESAGAWRHWGGLSVRPQQRFATCVSSVKIHTQRRIVHRVVDCSLFRWARVSALSIERWVNDGYDELSGICSVLVSCVLLMFAVPDVCKCARVCDQNNILRLPTSNDTHTQFAQKPAAQDVISCTLSCSIQRHDATVASLVAGERCVVAAHDVHNYADTRRDSGIC